MGEPVPILVLGALEDVPRALAEDPGASHYLLTFESPDQVDPARVVRDFGAVLIDLRGTAEGLALVRSFRKASRRLPCILLAKPDQERDAVEAVRYGAFDYQVWPPADRGDLWALVGRCVRKAQPDDPFATPEKLGRYRLLRHLGTGGMAEVFLAEPTDGQGISPVVVKRLLPHLAMRREFVDMFMDEARISSLLDHPNIVAVYDFGRVDEHLYIVMECVQGWSLEDIGKRARWRFPVYSAVHIASEICAGLAYAHSRTNERGEPLGIVHRDINPPNILVSDIGEIKVADFGIAKARQRYSESSSGIVKGKLSYMTPEQVNGEDLDHRVDVYAAGVVLYKMLTGRTPFYGPSPFDIMMKIRAGRPDPPSTLNGRVYNRLDRVVLKALAKEPKDRFANAQELNYVLRSMLQEPDLASARVDTAAWIRQTMESGGPEGDEPWSINTDSLSVPVDLAPSTPPAPEPTEPRESLSALIARTRLDAERAEADAAALENQEVTIIVPKRAESTVIEPARAESTVNEAPKQTSGPTEPTVVVGPPQGAGGAAEPTVPVAPSQAETITDRPPDVTVTEPAEPATTDVGPPPPKLETTDVGPPPKKLESTDVGPPPKLESTEVGPPPPKLESTDIGPAPKRLESTVTEPPPPDPDGSTVDGLFPTAPAEAQRTRRRRLIVGTIAVVILAGVFAVWRALPKRGGPAPTATPTTEGVAGGGATHAPTRSTTATPTAAAVVSHAPRHTPTPRPTPTRLVAHPTPRPTARVARTRTPSPTRTPVARHTPAAAAKMGKLSIWTDVWATVTIDGKPIPAKTPVFGLEVPAGRHRVTLENSALGARKTVTVTVRANHESKLNIKLR